MTLYLVRHAKAQNYHPVGDAFRELTGTGILTAQAMADQARQRGMSPDVFLSSPYARARDTARIFMGSTSGELQLSTALTPDAELTDAFEELSSWVKNGADRLAVFSHNPFIALFAAYLTPPSTHRELTFHTATVVALGFNQEFLPGSGRLLWIEHPLND
ncbi:MAG: hypothetical protein HKM05_08275 [Spirochaetales bacterium]|nr:hypothetical protein [Spirochaetales bacterium]